MNSPAHLATAMLLACLSMPALAQSLRFNGNPSAESDRVEILLDAPARPLDVGAHFTIELWLRAAPGSNAVDTACGADNDAWIAGNIAIDRDVFGAGDFGDYGVSLMRGRIAFGVSVGAAGATACGGTDLRDDAWHHVALTRNASSGQLRIYVDGQLDGQAAGASGDVSYRDGRATAWPASDPLLVLGNEKHFGPAAFSGWMDELRISRTLRYASNFPRPDAAFSTDLDTVALYSFDEGQGQLLGDRSGAVGGPSPGALRVGGSPSGPQWSGATPFTTGPLFADGFEPLQQANPKLQMAADCRAYGSAAAVPIVDHAAPGAGPRHARAAVHARSTLRVEVSSSVAASSTE